jgi:hypothetical protein
MAPIGVTSVSEGKEIRLKGEKKRALGGDFTRRKEGTTMIIVL